MEVPFAVDSYLIALPVCCLFTVNYSIGYRCSIIQSLLCSADWTGGSESYPSLWPGCFATTFLQWNGKTPILLCSSTLQYLFSDLSVFGSCFQGVSIYNLF